MFNGDNRDEVSRCHRDTRKSIIDNVEPWALDPHSEGGVLWLTGSVGTGKTAVSRKVCEDLDKQGPQLLAGSYFFSRDACCNSLKTFVPTIAYRLTVAFPEVGELIRQALAHDPAILEYSLETQWEDLIIKPLCKASPRINPTYRSLIVIDGLDECESYFSQLRLLHLLLMFKQHDLHQQIAVLISSRPESHIRSEFRVLADEHPSLFRHPYLALIETDESIQDMQLVIAESLNDIRRRHPRVHNGSQWLIENGIMQIIDFANGPFACISAIIQSLHRFTSAEALLRAICEHQVTLEPLDSQYELILNSASRGGSHDILLPCLLFLTQLDGSTTFRTLYRFFQESCSIENMRIMLQLLHSVLQVPEEDSGTLQVYHRSFLNYLLGPRSGQYCILDKQVVEQLFIQVLSTNYEAPGDHGWTWRVETLWLRLPYKIIEVSPGIVNALSQTNAVDRLRERWPQIRDERTRIDYYTFHRWLRSCPFPIRKKGPVIPSDVGLFYINSLFSPGLHFAQVSTQPSR